MEKLSILLVILFLILCAEKLYFSESFVEGDINNATVTMSLSDLLHYSGSYPKGSIGNSNVRDNKYDYNLGRGGDSYYDNYGGDLGSYLYLKNEMTREFKEKLQRSNGGYSFQPTNIEPPSCAQGSSYMETVPLKVPASCSQ
jgi:hypothetical protein